MRHHQSTPLQIKASPLIMVKCQNLYVFNYWLKIFKECLVAVQILQKKIYFSCLNILITGCWKTYLPLTSKILRLKIPLGIYGFTAIELGQDSLCLLLTTYRICCFGWDFLIEKLFGCRRPSDWDTTGQVSTVHDQTTDRSRGLFIQFVRTEIFMLISDPACD